MHMRMITGRLFANPISAAVTNLCITPLSALKPSRAMSDLMTLPCATMSTLGLDETRRLWSISLFGSEIHNSNNLLWSLPGRRWTLLCILPFRFLLLQVPSGWLQCSHVGALRMRIKENAESSVAHQLLLRHLTDMRSLTGLLGLASITQVWGAIGPNTNLFVGNKVVTPNGFSRS